MTKLNVIALFDMDGTLTLPRKKIKSETIQSLKRLSSIARIGIISGSDFEYIIEQCSAMFDMGCVSINDVDILPCNGTKLIRWSGNDYEVQHEVDMIEEIGDRTYKNILTKIFEWQAEITRLYPDLPFTGTFVQYRGSLLNWCPIGRVANSKQRESWKKWDLEWSIRYIYADELKKFIAANNIPVTVALGGATSFDIYPNGWNKTYGLKHYAGKDVFFVGDKCQADGNDWHIFNALNASGNAWETTGPEDTVSIINQLIERLQS